MSIEGQERFSPQEALIISILSIRLLDFRIDFFHASHFDRQVIRTNIQKLKSYGYNTIRVFLDTCNDGAGCIGNLNGQGLNIEYMRNVAALMQIAREEDFFFDPDIQ